MIYTIYKFCKISVQKNVHKVKDKYFIYLLKYMEITCVQYTRLDLIYIYLRSL